ncbi:MAG: peptidylprolyl isomerase [Rhodobacteraceae bacterium]|nr:peptidylprolyl isomerase [Paracoccaceae bacterium]
MNIRINGVAIAPAPDQTAELLTARELLRQRAVVTGFLKDEVNDQDEIDQALETLLGREVVTPTPNLDECQRYYDNNPGEFLSGDLVHARHILFQVTKATPIPEIRAKAEQTLNGLLANPERFAEVARELSNCPSGQQDGNLGQISRGDMVPEFEAALFRLAPTGLLPEIVKTRFGFHIISVDRRIPGEKMPFDMVRAKIEKRLIGKVEEKAIRQYISVLAAQAKIEGIDLEAASSPLVQ